MLTWAVEHIVVTRLRRQTESVTGHTGLTTVVITLGNAGEQARDPDLGWRAFHDRHVALP